MFSEEEELNETLELEIELDDDELDEKAPQSAQSLKKPSTEECVAGSDVTPT